MSQAYQANKSSEEIVGKEEAAQMYKMSANENPFGPSPRATEAMQASLSQLGLYPPYSDIALREKLAAVHGRGLTADNFVLSNGGSEALHLTAMAYLDAQSSILQCPPAFPVYERTAKQQGAGIINVPLDSETFAYYPEAIKKAIQPSTRVVYICNPNNPTGTTFAQDVFEALLSAIPDDVLMVYDEVYYHFASNVTLPDVIAAVLAEKNVLVVHSFSKSYGLAGLRLGYGMGRPEIIARLEAQKNAFHVNALALKAGEAALTDYEHIQKTVTNNTAGRKFISESLQAMGLRVWPSEANFVLFEVPQGVAAADLADRLLEHKIMVRPAFGLDHHLRVSVALPEANETFVHAMKALI